MATSNERIIQFFSQEYIPALETITPGTEALWGKMNLHQMIEHMSYFTQVAYGKSILGDTLVTPEERLPRMHEFLMSDMPFKENTKNALLGEEPPAPKTATVEAAISELEDAVKELLAFFNNNPEATVFNPIFGNLDATLTYNLLYKHAWHHLKQFGINP